MDNIKDIHRDFWERFSSQLCVPIPLRRSLRTPQWKSCLPTRNFSADGLLPSFRTFSCLPCRCCLKGGDQNGGYFFFPVKVSNGQRACSLRARPHKRVTLIMVGFFTTDGKTAASWGEGLKKKNSPRLRFWIGPIWVGPWASLRQANTTVTQTRP